MEIQYGGLSIACGGRFHCVCTTDTCKAQTGGFERETAHIHRNKVLFDAFLTHVLKSKLGGFPANLSVILGHLPVKTVFLLFSIDSENG